MKTSITDKRKTNGHVYLLGGVQAAGTGSLQTEQFGPAVHQRARDSSTPRGALLSYSAPLQGARPTGYYNNNNNTYSVVEQC